MAGVHLEKFIGFDEKLRQIRIGVKVSDATAGNGNFLHRPSPEFLIFFTRHDGAWVSQEGSAGLFGHLPKSIKEYVEQEVMLGWFRDCDLSDDVKEKAEQKCGLVDYRFSAYCVIETMHDDKTQTGGGTIVFSGAEVIQETFDYLPKWFEQEVVLNAA